LDDVLLVPAGVVPGASVSTVDATEMEVLIGTVPLPLMLAVMLGEPAV